MSTGSKYSCRIHENREENTAVCFRKDEMNKWTVSFKMKDRTFTFKVAESNLQHLVREITPMVKP